MFLFYLVSPFCNIPHTSLIFTAVDGTCVEPVLDTIIVNSATRAIGLNGMFPIGMLRTEIDFLHLRYTRNQCHR